MNVTTYAVVGKPVTREDGPDKVSGHTRYSGDLILPGMLWGKVLRSPVPHARIVHIDIAGAFVKDRIRLWKQGVRDLVMELCCVLHNFRVRLSPWQPMI